MTSSQSPSQPAATPVVGQGCTKIGYTDRTAFRVIKVDPKGRWALVQEDTAKLLNGCNSGEPDALQFAAGGFVGHTSGTQRWQLDANPEGAVERISLRKDGTWKGKGPHGERFRLDVHFHHYDFNF
jgi:hypothetical protein